MVGVRRPAKMPELKENIEPLTVQGQGIYTFSREPENDVWKTPLTDVWKTGSPKAETKMSQGCHCADDAPTDLKVTDGVNI